MVASLRIMSLADLSNTFVREIERKDGQSLKINQCEIGDVGCVVWDAALVLSKYLESEDFRYGLDLQQKHVVELGAGTGVTGLMAASFGANVFLTDLEEFVPLMQLNIKANRDLCKGCVEARALKWGSEHVKQQYRDVDIILIADCIYYEESLEPLVKTLDDLSGLKTCVYCCYEERTSGNKPELQRKFLKLTGELFQIEEIPLERHDEHFRSDDIHILKMTRLKGK